LPETAQERVPLLAELIYNRIDPQAKAIEILYDHGVLLGCDGGQDPNP